MKYVSIDTETTGLKVRSPDRLIGVSFVVEDTNNILPHQQLPHFTCLIRQEEYRGEPFALQMNARFLHMIATGKTSYPILEPDEWVRKAAIFLDHHFPDGKKIFAAGKNVAGFDMQFLPPELRDRFNYKTIDVGSIFMDWDLGPPGMSTIKKQFGLGIVSHDMYEDAIDNILVLRTKYATRG